MLAVSRLRNEIFVRGPNRFVIQLRLFVGGAISARQDNAVLVGGGAERFGIGSDQGGKHVPHIGNDFTADLHVGVVEDEKRVVSRCTVKGGELGGDRVGLRIDVFKIDENQLSRGYLGGGDALLYVALVPCLDDRNFRSRVGGRGGFVAAAGGDGSGNRLDCEHEQDDDDDGDEHECRECQHAVLIGFKSELLFARRLPRAGLLYGISLPFIFICIPAGGSSV